MMKFSLNCQGRLLDLSTPKVMAVINLTPDSFFQESRFKSDGALLLQVEKALTAGAAIIDLGGQSTRPGAEMISDELEWDRIKDGLVSIKKEFPDSFVSVDTFYSTIARRAADQGASIINDISGGSLDTEMIKTIGQLKIPYVLMHLQGTPTTMQKSPKYENVVLDVWNYFENKIIELKQSGVEQFILDPGFGFGKNNEHNYLLLKNLQAFTTLRYPILVGLSRKSMINKVLQIKATEALNGTTVLNTLAILNGANILRVHDVIEAQQVITLLEEYQKV